MSIKKTFVLNNNFASLAKSHITQLFQPSFNPKLDDDAYVTALANSTVVTNSFSLQEYPRQIAGLYTNAVMGPYTSNVGTNDAKNIVTNLFLVTENFLNFINKINLNWQNDVRQSVITPVTYTPTGAVGYTVAADTSEWTQIFKAFAGPSGNAASSGLAAYEAAAAVGIEGNTGSMGVQSTNIPELFLRHLYSTDSKKRDIAFNFAQTFYGISSAEVTSAKLEMIPAADFDSDLFKIAMTNDVIKFDYDKPIKLQEKYLETIRNVGNKKLYLYFPVITSNAMRANKESDLDYRNMVNIYTGLANPSAMVPPVLSNTSFKGDFIYRQKATTGISPLVSGNVPNLPTLVNSVWSVTKNKTVFQASYTALQISEVGGGGDLQFDHIDKIDYIDSLSIEIKVPTVFS